MSDVSLPHVLAGTVAGASEALFVHPLDTYKVRLQTSMHGGVATGAAGYKFPTTLKEGLTLWKGVGPAITRGVICGSVWLGTNEYFKRLLGAKESEPFGPAFLAATTLTGVAELALYCPAEVIKTQLQVGRHPTVATAATSLWKAGGMRAMYMGGLPMLMRNVVGNATFFCSYASIQSMFGIDRSNGKQPSTTSTMASGATAGALYYFVGHPFDTVQAVMKAQSAPKETFSGMMDAVRFLTSQKTGWRTLFRGVLPNVIQAIPGGAVSMLAFEFTLAALGPSTVRPVGERLKAIKDKVTGMRDFTVYV